MSLFRQYFPCVLSLIFAAVAPAQQYVQQGQKLLGSTAQAAAQGWSVAVSADGNTAVVGGPNLGYPQNGAVWFFTRSGSTWTQQGPGLVPSNASGTLVYGVNVGSAVSISSDGNTVLVGGPGDTAGTNTNNIGAAWIYTRANGAWAQGPKLMPTAYVGAPRFGISVALSGDGNTAIVGGNSDSPDANGNGVGAAWVFNKNGGAWTQAAKLVGAGASGQSRQGSSVALNSNGSTALIGGPADNSNVGATWAFTLVNGSWTAQGGKLIAGDVTQTFARQGASVSLSSDGNTAAIGGWEDNNYVGAAWVWVRSGSTWSEQSKLIGSNAVNTPFQGWSVAISSDASTVAVGGPQDSGLPGAVWVFKKSGSGWSQVGTKLVASGANPANLVGDNNNGQGYSVSLSGDGSVLLEGAPNDNANAGAFWVFTFSGTASVAATGPIGTLPGTGSALGQTMTFTFTDPRGWQDLGVVNILINNFLDGRASCYLAYSVPSSVLYVVPDAGGGLSSGLTLGGTGAIGNSQCSITAAGSSASGSGNVLTLTLNITFTNSFAGNKVIYMAARDQQNNNSGWQALGAWSVPGASTFPLVTGVSPAHSSGSSATFVFTYNDTKGFQDLGVLNVLINNFLDGRSACYIAYSVPSAVVYLVPDNGGGLTSGLALGGSGSISNSQCTINSQGSSAQGSGGNFTLTLNIQFTQSFNGNRVIYMAGRDGTGANNSGWQSMGSWTVQ